MNITFTVTLNLPYTETLTEDEIKEWTRASVKYGERHQDYGLTVKEIVSVEEGIDE